MDIYEIKVDETSRFWKTDREVEGGQLRWYYHDAGEARVYRSEPQSSWWRRFKVGFYGLLPIEGQL